MITKRLLPVVLALVIVTVAGAVPAAAVGPDALLDGVWFVQETGPSNGGPPTFFASIHQTGTVAAAILLSLEGEWIYATGTRTGSAVQGTVHFPDGSLAATFSVVVTSPTTLTGQSTRGGLSTPFVGNKVF